MKGISPSTDELMWLIAEEGEPSAVDAFIRRYPENRSELIKRLNMVRDLKGARPPQARILSKPRFEGRDPAPLATRTWLRAALAAVPLVAVLWASYWLTSGYLRRLEGPVEVSATASPAPVRSVLPKPANVVPPIIRGPDTANLGSTPAAPATPYERPLSLHEEKITLLEALAEIARVSGLSVELAPEVPNPTISVDYSGIAALMVLKDMGQTLGFTAFDQGDGRVLIIPAVDPKTQDAPPVVPGGGTRPDDEASGQPATGRRMGTTDPTKKSSR